MKRILFSLLSLVIVFSFAPSASAQNTQDFTIKSFEADYYLTRNTDKEVELSVVETIVVEFPSYDQNHGILRALPNTYKDKSLRLEVESVRDKYAKDVSYSASDRNDNTVLKIGDADKYVHGEQTYVISYTLRDAITYYDEHDEWYWNVNGTQWQQPFGVVQARIHLPEELAKSITKQTKCFTGYQGATESNCSVSQQRDDKGVMITITAKQLLSGQNMTFLMGFSKGTFAPYTPTTWERFAPFIKASPALLLPLLTAMWVFNKWRRTGKDPKGRGVIVPQYVPLKGFNALRADGVLEERVRQNAITSAIIELATARYIIIHEAENGKKREYSLELAKVPSGFQPEQMKLIHALFGEVLEKGEVIHLKDLKNKLYKDYATINKDVMKALHAEGYFSNNPLSAGSGMLALGVGLMLVGFFIITTGFLLWIAIGMGVSGLIILLSAKTMPARSVQGVEARDYLLGLKDYINLAEKDRIQYLQSPEGVRQFGDPSKKTTQIKLFETLLPYAMLFGLEKKWAEQFKDLYTQPPEWYQGNVAGFHHGHFASSLGSFTSATNTTFTAPSSSGSSGYSGGGGFSGGGGGGGGGGGW